MSPTCSESLTLEVVHAAPSQALHAHLKQPCNPFSSATHLSRCDSGLLSLPELWTQRAHGSSLALCSHVLPSPKDEE